MVLGLDNETWANHCTESALRNMILQDLDALLYYFDTDWQTNGTPILPPGDLKVIAIILAQLTLFYSLVPMPAPHTSSVKYGGMTTPHDLHLADPKETFHSFADEY